MSKTNENFLNLTIGDQVYYLNNVSIEPVNISTNGSTIMNDYRENVQNFTNDNLFWIPSTTMPNNYFEFPYVQITNTTDTNIRVEEGLQFLNILHQGQFNDNGSNYIDLNVVDHHFNNGINCESNNKTNKLNTTNVDDINNVKDVNDEEDDVVFVKEYYLNRGTSTTNDNNINNNNNKAKMERNIKKKITLPEPRRNPKRQVQLQKASYDLAMKLSSSSEMIIPMRTRRNQHNNNDNYYHHHHQELNNNNNSSSDEFQFKKPVIQQTRRKKLINHTTSKLPSSKLTAPSSTTTSNGKRIVQKVSRKRDKITKNLIDNVGNTLSSVIEHVKNVKNDNIETNDDDGYEEKKKYLNELRIVLKNTCQLFCAINGDIDDIEI